MLILILTSIAIIGAVTVSLGKPLAANVLWLISNPAMALYNYNIKEFEMAGMFAVYSIIAIFGVWNLRLKFIVKYMVYN